jgi:hypothetical protein
MGKSKGPRRKSPPSPKKSQPPPPPPLRCRLMSAVYTLLRFLGRMLAGTVRPGWHALVSISVIATLVGLGMSFWPTMTVTVSDPSDASNAYSVTFTISNTGFLPFEDVRIAIGVCAIETVPPSWQVSPGTCDNGRVPNMLATDPSWYTPELRRNEPFSIRLTDVFNKETEKWRKDHPTAIASFQMMPPLKAANFILVVNFKPWPLPKEIRFPYRFVAEEQPDGKVLWRAVPLSWEKISLPPMPPPFPAPLPPFPLPAK